MAQWVSNGPCPKCGSRDNLATYDDGSKWCWGCHYKEPPKHAPKLRLEDTEKEFYLPPKDATSTILSPGLEWIKSYGITDKEIKDNNILWSSSQRQLIFSFYGEKDQLLGWQARNFSESSKSKYFTQGPIKEMLTFYQQNDNNLSYETVVLVEDCVSGLCIARQIDSLPLFGCSIALSKINALKRYYSNVLIWLDPDKYKEAQGIAKRASMMGLSTNVIFTEQDPKEYRDIEITDFLQKALDKM